MTTDTMHKAALAEREALLIEAIDKVAADDPLVAQLVAQIGYPAPRLHQAGFATLAGIVISQQVSTQSAAAIKQRVKDGLHGEISAVAIHGCSADQLRALGLSRQKVVYLQGLASAVIDDGLQIEEWRTMDSSAVIKAITALKGFGRWSAEIYCMFALSHQDLYPVGDLALVLALQRLHGLPDKPSEKAAAQLALKWSPYRSAMALMMWHYYGSTTLQ